MDLLLGVLVVLFAAKYTLTNAGPRAGRAIAAKRRASIDRWRAEHPTGPASARWAAAAAGTAAAIRWGPKHTKRGFAEAWREGIARGKEKFRPEDWPEPRPNRDDAGNLFFGDDPADPNGTKRCPTCKGKVVVDGKPCTACAGRCQARSDDFDDRNPGPAPPSPAPAGAGHGAQYSQGPRPFVYDLPVRANGANVPTSAPAPSTTATATLTRSTTMPVQTATGGEIANAEQFLAEARTIQAEAATDREDAAADLARAEEDLARIDRVIASLKKHACVANDIAKVAQLRDPAAARVEGARIRLAAATTRLAGANAVVEIAVKHYQLIGKAAGPFYNPNQ